MKPRLSPALQHRVFEQDALDLGIEFEGGQLQQLDRLLQLRRERELLGEAELQRGFHAARQEKKR